MAYQTLPNTFVSGGTIYSTAVSANMVALLQGYTTGNYDGSFVDLDCDELDVGGGNVSVSSGGTATFAGNMNVAGSAVVSGAISGGSSLDIAGTASVDSLAVTGDATVGGNVTVTGTATVYGDVITTNTTDWTPSFLNSVMVSTAASGQYHTVGDTVYAYGTIQGTADKNDYEIVTLPVTAATLPQFSDCVVPMQSGGAYVPGILRPVANQAYALLIHEDTSFVSGVTYRVSYQYVYRRL